MKHIILVALMFLVACMKESKKGSELYSTKSVGTPYTSIIVDEPETPAVVEETAVVKDLECEVSDESERNFLSLSTVNKTIMLKEKLVFQGYTFSPSQNENAAVHHDDQDFYVKEGRVIKITGRIVLNDAKTEGELQIAYKVRTEDKKIIELPFSKLADIKDCL